MTAPGPLSWLRQAITERLELARGAATPGDLRGTGARLEGGWETGCRCEGECRSYPACEEVTGDGNGGGIHIYSEGGHDSWQAAHIAANDPRDVIARCEGELGILDEHALADYGYGPYCRTCFDPSDGLPHALPFPCKTLVLLAAGYRHHPGYAEAGWGT